MVGKVRTPTFAPRTCIFGMLFRRGDGVEGSAWFTVGGVDGEAMPAVLVFVVGATWAIPCGAVGKVRSMIMAP